MKARRIRPDEFSAILTETLIERIHNLDDAEIARATEALCGFDAPDLPSGVKATRKYVKLRASETGSMSAPSFAAQAKNYRDRTFVPLLLVPLMVLAREAVDREVQKRVNSLSEALPAVWGRAQSDGLTPLQAYLITYSVASDDYLWHSQANLQISMKSTEQAMTNSQGHYPASAGRHAYGVNGYLYSTPLDLILDQRTTTRLLDRLEQRSTK